MVRKALMVTGLAVVLAAPAMAQTGGTSGTSGSNGTNGTSSASGMSSGNGSAQSMGTPTAGMNGMSVRQHLMQDLQKAGYTDVSLMPASFLARAKDKAGQPVMILINPDSVTTIVEAQGSKTAGK